MDSGVTTDGMSARSMPTPESKTPPAETGESPAGPVTGPAPRQPAKGSEVRVTRCPIHGIAYDGEREVCPGCAKGEPSRKEPTDRTRPG